MTDECGKDSLKSGSHCSPRRTQVGSPSQPCQQLHSAQVAKRTAEKRYPRLANKRCRSATMALRSNSPKSRNRTVYLGKRTKIWRAAEVASAPHFYSMVVAAGCQKRRRRVKRNRLKRAAVPRQSRHTSRRRVVAGQQPQSHGLVAAAGCQKRRRRVKRHKENRVTNDSDSGKGCEIQEKHGMAVQLRSNAQRFRTGLFTGAIKNKYGEKEEWHQRHNLTMLSYLPVARSGAVG
jgi:hypothetical protein